MSDRIEGEGGEDLNLGFIPDIGSDLDFRPQDDIQLAGGDLKMEDEPQEPKESAKKLVLDLLKEEGIIDYDPEEYEDTDDAFKNILNSNFDKKANQLSDEKLDAKLENLPEQFKQIFGYHKDGIDVSELMGSQERLANYLNIQKQDYSDNKELQKDIVLTWLNEQGYDDKEAEDQLKKYSAVGDDFLKEQADLAIKKLVVKESKDFASLKEQADEAKLTKEEKKKTEYKNWEKSILDMKEIVPGIKISDIDKKKILDILTKPIATDKTGRPQTALNKLQVDDPTFLAKVAYFAVMNKWDFSQFKKQAQTDVLGKLKSTIGESTEYKGSSKQDEILSKLRRLKK